MSLIIVTIAGNGEEVISFADNSLYRRLYEKELQYRFERITYGVYRYRKEPFGRFRRQRRHLIF